jgi:hypothetical protein
MAKLYDRKSALVAADLLNDRVLPFFEEQGVPLLRILTDRGSEYCGNREYHEYEQDNRRRRLFVGIGFNVSKLLQKYLNTTVLDYIQIPYTSVLVPINLDKGKGY